MKPYSMTALAVVVWLLATGGCERPGPAHVKNSRGVMGTFAEVTAYAVDRATAQQAVEAAYARLDDINRLMSDYVDDTEIGRFNSTAGTEPGRYTSAAGTEPGRHASTAGAEPGRHAGRWAGDGLVVSPETFHCLQKAAEVSRLSGGAFDVTCRPLVRLWKQAGKVNKLPTEAALRETLERVGWQKLKLDPATRTVTPIVDGMQIDLGGIAKGYALDLAAAAMQDAGASSALVNVGGDVRAVGSRPDGQPWVIGVRHPFEEGLFCRLAVADCAVATSGVQQRFTEIERRRYSHIIDPRSGRPAEQAPSVTVIAPDGLTADAWATAFSVLSVAEGQALLARELIPGIEVLWITRTDGRVVVQQTPGFEMFIVP